MIELCSLASNMHPLLPRHLELKTRAVQYQSDCRATKTVHVTEWPQLFVVKRGTGSSNAHNQPTEAVTLLISDIPPNDSGPGLTSAPFYCHPRRNGRHRSSFRPAKLMATGSARSSDVRSDSDHVRGCEGLQLQIKPGRF